MVHTDSESAAESKVLPYSRPVMDGRVLTDRQHMTEERIHTDSGPLDVDRVLVNVDHVTLVTTFYNTVPVP